MTKGLRYDLHLHSCLSPCGDGEMTVNNIVNMAILNDLDLIALTDHNSCKNCPAILEVAQAAGKLVLPGMELCTAEEIHVVCLFPGLQEAMAFDAYVYSQLLPIANKVDIYGHQQILNAQDEVTGEEPLLLVTASQISLDQVPGLMREYGGVAFPAHIDKNAYSVLAVYGYLPPELGFHAVEVARPGEFLAQEANRQQVAGKVILTDSDAHYLWDIKEESDPLPLEAWSFSRFAAYLQGKA